MKTFDKSDLITWYNRDKAEVGKRYYCADSLNELLHKINSNAFTNELTRIDEDDISTPFRVKRYGEFEAFPCILPVDKVIEKEEKKFRPLKNVKEFYKLVFYTEGKSEEDCIYELISDCILHLKSKQSGAEYYTAIRSICKNEDIQILINSSLTFEDLFDEFEIELNGKWVPFGIEETAE